MSETITTLTPGQRLHLRWRLNGGIRVVDVVGEVDVFTCRLLRDRLLMAVTDDGGGHSLIVNLAGVSFLDSSGLGILVGVWHRMQACPGILALAAPTRQVQRIFNITGLAKAFSVYDTEVQAVQACRGRDGVACRTLKIVS
jgi:anti-sigma B factor antagonist